MGMLGGPILNAHQHFMLPILNWRQSPNRRTLSIDRQDQPQVLDGLRRANDVTLVASFDGGSQTNLVMPLGGSSTAMGPFLEVCGPLDSLLR
jgi:hypothetical protein